MRTFQVKSDITEPERTGRANQAGFTLMEILIALSIFAIGILAVATMQIRAMQVNNHAGNITESTTWAQDKMEELITLAWNHADLNAGNNPHTDTMPDGTVVTWNVTDIDLGPDPGAELKRIAMTSTYQDSAKTFRTISITSAYPRVAAP
jgi:prepilin-type N-terminal cleavage/methylation domain-containing protein